MKSSRQALFPTQWCVAAHTLTLTLKLLVCFLFSIISFLFCLMRAAVFILLQVCSVGGGGLYIGIVQGLQRHGLVHVPVVAVETIGCDSMCSSVQQQQHVTLPAITSIATTLGAKKIADKAWQLCRSHPTRCVRVTDAAAVRACHRFLDDHRVLVEPACGAALAAIYDAASELQGFKCVVVIACGGSTCTAAMLGEWSAKLGV